MKNLAALLVLLAPWAAFADTYPRQPGIDAIHYVFRLTLVDSSNEVAGEATVQLRMAEDNVTEAVLDLASGGDRGGMTVSSVTNGDKRATFSHADNRLRIGLPRGVTKGQDVAFTIQYRGVPAEGLRLIPNIHGERTVFSENWPHRARHWLPMIDHPYDKATGEFIVTAPAHYQVVANGVLVEETTSRTAGGARTGSSRCRSRRGSTRSAWRASRSTTTGLSAASRSRRGCFRRTASRV